MSANSYRYYTTEFQPSAQVWVAYYCGCSECPKGLGKTEEEAVKNLEGVIFERDVLWERFDCHYDGDINACDKDCKQLGVCKRRTSSDATSQPPSIAGSDK